MSEIRPDFSNYVAHFTSANKATPEEMQGQQILTADMQRRISRDRLAKILSERKILATKMPNFGAYCAAFTECTWTSLFAHAQHYSPYGIGFFKYFLWQNGGGPAIYLRPDLYEAQSKYLEEKSGHAGNKPFASELKDFLTPFAMEPFTRLDGTQSNQVDFTHEREWRVPSGLAFDYTDVQFVILNDLDELNDLPAEAVSAVGQDRFISMSNYKRIEQLWPVTAVHTTFHE